MRAGALLAALLAAGAAGSPEPAATGTPTASPAPAPPQASPRAVHTRLSTAAPRLGEPFTYEIEIRHPTAERYTPPAAPTLDPFSAEPLGCASAPVPAAAPAAAPGAAGDSLTTCGWRLRLFVLGPRDVPAIDFDAATPGGARRLTVPGPRVEAAGVIDPRAPTDQLQLRPPAPPVPLLVRSWRLVAWAAGAVAALAALVLLLRWWRRRGRRAAEPLPPLPPHERFARRLDALAADRLPEQGRSREFFFRLSEAVREYLGALTGVNALDLTTGELLDALAAEGDPRLDLATLRAFSEDADLVKFARAPAGGPECEAGLRYARELLVRTRPAATGPGAAIPPTTSTPTPTSTSTPTPTRDHHGGPA